MSAPSAARAVLAVASNHLRMMSRTPFYLLMDLALPLLIAAVPMLLGRSFAGPGASSAFSANTGTNNPFLFMLLGSTQFVLVGGALFNVGSWVRRELQAGTLESVFATPNQRVTIVLGVCVYGLLKDLAILVVSLSVACLVLGARSFDLRVVAAIGWMVLGAIPTYAMAVAYAALVLQLREVSALTQLLQGATGLLMGVFFPVEILPKPLQVLAWCFPPTWSIHGMRSLLLGMSWRLGALERDLSVMLALAVIFPVLALLLFRRAEEKLLAAGGFGGL